MKKRFKKVVEADTDLIECVPFFIISAILAMISDIILGIPKDMSSILFGNLIWFFSIFLFILGSFNLFNYITTREVYWEEIK